MAFLLFFAGMAFGLHLFALLALKPRTQLGRWLPLLVMEGLPLFLAVQCVAEKPSDYVFSWTDQLILIGFLALAILTGCLLALAAWRKEQ